MIPHIQSTIFQPYHSCVIMGGPGDAKYIEAARVIRRTTYCGAKYQIFSQAVDPRLKDDKAFEVLLESYTGYKPISINIEKVHNSKEILEKLKPDTTAVGILGAHFFDMGLVDAARKLKKEGKFIVMAGIDKTYESDPFGPMAYLALDADRIKKYYGKCSHLGCRNTATRVHRVVEGEPAPWGDDTVKVGEDVKYENVCLLHYNCEGSPQEELLAKYRGKSARVGKLTSFFGTMGSGKSEMMLSTVLQESKAQGFDVMFLKPKIDTRTPGKVASREFAEAGKFGMEFPAREIDDDNMWQLVDEAASWKPHVIGIDEAQFVKNLSIFVNSLRLLGHDVVTTGLAKDFRTLPFGDMDYAVAEAERVEPLEAACMVKGCINKAIEVQRLINGKPADYNAPLVVIDSDGTKKTSVEYMARCIFHHEVPGMPENMYLKPRRKTVIG